MKEACPYNADLHFLIRLPGFFAQFGLNSIYAAQKLCTRFFVYLKIKINKQIYERV
jgi:hypothetical protein